MNSERIRSFIYDLEQKEFYRYLLLFFAVFIALLALLLYYHYYSISNFQQRLKRVNKQREEVRVLLQEHALVEQQRNAVDAILEKNKDFRISHFFELAVRELGLSQKMSKDTVIDHDLSNGYIETQLDSSLKDMDMKEVVDLLYKIEQNDRVYTKELVLLKSPKSSKLDVSLVIATLQPKITVS